MIIILDDDEAFYYKRMYQQSIDDETSLRLLKESIESKTNFKVNITTSLELTRLLNELNKIFQIEV